MKNIKCVIFDVDGTLKEDGKKNIHEENLKMLKRLALKRTVVIATGRPLNTVPKDLENLAHYYICSNGAAIFNQNKELLHSIPADSDEVAAVIKYCWEKKLNFGYKNALDGFYVNVNGDIPKYLENEKDLSIITEVLADVSSILSLFIDLTVEDAENLAKIAPGMNFDHSGWEHNGIIHFEIYSKKAGKLNSSKQLCELESINLSNVMAFGDSGNDIELLSAAGHGVLMGNAKERFRTLGLVECGTNNELGIISYLEKMKML